MARKKRTYGLYLFLIGIVFLTFSMSYADKSLEELMVSYGGPTSKFIDIEGVNVHYRDEGNGDVIVLIHGTASSLHTWDDWAKELRNTHRVIRMDIPAFGLTGPNTSRDYTIDSYVSFLHQFFKALAIEDMVLVGSSLGGNIAWQYTAKYPDEVEKLVLVDASGLPTGKPKPWIFTLAKTPIIKTLFLRITPKEFVKKNLEQVYENDTLITPELVTRYHDLALRQGNRQAFIDRAHLDFHHPFEESVKRLQGLTQPTLIIWGENDIWVPLHNGIQFDSILPNSQLIIMPKTGHVPMEERPKESLQFLMDFLKSSPDNCCKNHEDSR